MPYLSNRLRWLSLSVLLGLFFITGCYLLHTDPEVNSPMNVNEYVIFSNTQLTYEALRIGVGNIRKEEYVNNQSDQEIGLTAGLWIYHRNDSSLNQQVRVYSGQELDIGNYHIVVDEINEDEKAFVRLLITKKE